MVVVKNKRDMIRYILFFCMVVILGACSEDKDTLELNAGPSVLDYQNYTNAIATGNEWTSGLPIVRGEGPFSYHIVSVSYNEAILDVHEFVLNADGSIQLSLDNTLALGQYTLAVKVQNAFGVLVNDIAIRLTVLESLNPQILIQTSDGSNEVELLVNPAGQPVDEIGNELFGILTDTRILFQDMSIGEVLMVPSDVFLFDRESTHVEEGDAEVGVVEMVGPFEPGTYELVFKGTFTDVPEAILRVNVIRLNLPYEKAIFSFDLSGEDSGARNNVTEDVIGGLNSHLIYGDLKSGKAFWNVQADKNHPANEFDTTPILRWLPFNAITGFESATANKSQSILIMKEAANVSNALELRIDAAFLSNKAADLSNELLRCDVLLATEEQYQDMMTMASQDDKKDAIATWQKVGTSFGAVPTAGVADATGYGFFELDLTVEKAQLPQSESGQIRVLFHMVADKNGPNPGYIAAQRLEVEGTFQDAN